MPIAGTAALRRVLNSRTYRMRCRASVTRAGVVLAEDVPVSSGREECDASLRVPERVVLTVPRTVAGVDWTPESTDDPLAPYGQRLHIKIGVDVGTDGVEWLDRGEFLIFDTRLAPGGNDLQVTAVGLLGLIEEAGLVTPFTPSTSYLQAVRSLVEPALTVVQHAELTGGTNTVPSGINYDDDRLAALYGILDAWPARAQITPEGYLLLMPADYYPADDNTGPYLQRYNFTTEDGIAQNLANVIDVGGALTRDGIYNTVVARGTASDGGQIMAAAYDRSGGPTSVGGPFNPLPVPYYYFSPLLDTRQKTQAAANSILTRTARLAPRAYEFNLVPDPRILLGDELRYRVKRSTYTEDEVRGVVEAVQMPYTSTSGPMQLTLRESS